MTEKKTPPLPQKMMEDLPQLVAWSLRFQAQQEPAR